MVSHYERFGKKAAGAMLFSALVCMNAVGQVQQVNLLEQPAISSVMATHSVMLSVSRAGQRLVAVGERGFIVVSEDNGRSWRQVVSPVSLTLVKVRFVDDHNGWAVGHGGVVLHSSDGGSTWALQLDGIRGAQVEFEAANAAAARSDHGTDIEDRLAQAQQLVADGPDKPLLDLLFFNAKEGIVVGAYGLAFATRDGGVTWSSIRGQIDNPSGLHLYTLQEIAGDVFIGGEQGILLREKRGTDRFEAMTSPYEGTAFGLQSMADGTLFLFGLRGNAFRSSDQGESWEKLDTLQSTTLTCGLRLADGSVVLADEAGRVLRYGEGSTKAVPMPLARSSYISGIAEAADGSLVFSSVRGMLSSAEPFDSPEVSK